MRTELVVVGALNRDLHFSVNHVPERGETVLGHYSVADGGKGANQAVQAALLAVTTALVGKVGDDEAGNHLLAELEMAGVDARFVGKSAGEPSGTGCIWSSSEDDKRIVVAPGANDELTEADVEAASGAIEAASVVLVQMEVPGEAVARAVALGGAGAATVVLNAAPASLRAIDLLPAVDVLIVNRGECATLTSMGVDTFDQVFCASERLCEMGVPSVVVTLGAEGAATISSAGRTRIAPVPVGPVDTTGAGDAFCGTMAACLTRGLDVVAAARVGSLAGALCATRRGARASIEDAGRIRRELTAARGRRA